MVDANEILFLLDEIGNRQLWNIYRKYGKGAVKKYKRLEKRRKPYQKIQFDSSGVPRLVKKSSKQRTAGRRAGKKAKAKKAISRRRSTNIRKSALLAKKVKRMGL